MLRICLLYGFLLLVTPSTKEDTTRKVSIRNGKTKATEGLGNQFGLLKVHSFKGLLDDGTPSWDLKCSSKSSETSFHSFFWMRKGPGQKRYKLVAGMTPKAGFRWPPKQFTKDWLKHQIIQDKQLVDGDYSQGGIVSFTLHIPLEPCEDEGHFKCMHYFEKDEKAKSQKNSAVIRFNTTLVCGKSRSAGIKSSKQGPSALAPLLEEENVSYADLAIEELAAIIVLVLILIVTIICCVHHRKKASKTKNRKEKKSDANLRTTRKQSRSGTGTSHSARHLNSRSHLSSHRQPSYSSTGPAYYSPRPNKSSTSPYQSMTRMNAHPPPPPPTERAPQSMDGPPPPPPIGRSPQSMNGPSPPSGPPRQMGGPTETLATARPDRNALLASINARRVSSSNL